MFWKTSLFFLQIEELIQRTSPWSTKTMRVPYHYGNNTLVLQLVNWLTLRFAIFVEPAIAKTRKSSTQASRNDASQERAGSDRLLCWQLYNSMLSRNKYQQTSMRQDNEVHDSYNVINLVTVPLDTCVLSQVEDQAILKSSQTWSYYCHSSLLRVDDSWRWELHGFLL